jgi:nicotinamide N-methyltransferase
VGSYHPMAVPATPSLVDLIETVSAKDEPDEESNEDIFSSGSRFLYPDDVRNSHGDKGVTVVYKSKRFDDISLLTADPEGEDERKLFSYYLWNAGILMAERISGERVDDELERRLWSVEGRSVLELGAGAYIECVWLGVRADDQTRYWSCWNCCWFGWGRGGGHI